MCDLISSNSQYFKDLTNVWIADRMYNAISAVQSDVVCENDGQETTSYRLLGTKSSHDVYVRNGKITSSTEYFFNPQTKTLGGKVYNNIIYLKSLPNGNQEYEITTPKGYRNTVRVRKNGSVLDINNLKNKLVKRKISKFVKNIVQKACVLL